MCGAFIRTVLFTYIVLTLLFAALRLLHDVVHELLGAQVFAKLASLLELQRAALDEAGVRLELECLLSGLDRWIRLHIDMMVFKSRD